MSALAYHGTQDAAWDAIADQTGSASYNLEHAFLAARHHDLRGFLYFYRLAVADVRAVITTAQDLRSYPEAAALEAAE